MLVCVDFGEDSAHEYLFEDAADLDKNIHDADYFGHSSWQELRNEA